MIFTHGGLTGGYAFISRDGKARFVYNMLAIERFTIVSETLPKGKINLAVNLSYEGNPGERQAGDGDDPGQWPKSRRR